MDYWIANDMTKNEPMDYFFINGKKVEAHECLIDNGKYFHFVNLNYFIKDWLIKAAIENKITLGYTDEKNPDNCGFDRNLIKVYDLQEGQFKSWTLAAINFLSESDIYKANAIETWNYIEYLHERLDHIVQLEGQKRQNEYNSYYSSKKKQQKVVEDIFYTMDESDYKRIAISTQEFCTNIHFLNAEVSNCLQKSDLQNTKSQFEFFNKNHDLFQKYLNTINKMQQVRQGTYEFLLINKQEEQEVSEELCIAQNNFAYDGMQPLPILDLEAYTFYQYAKRLSVSIEDISKILEETGGDESEIKKLQELIDSNNSDTKKRAILKNNKKYSEAARRRRNRRPEYYDPCIDTYKDIHEHKIEETYQKIKNKTLSYKLARDELNSNINNISDLIRKDHENLFKNKMDAEMAIAKFIRLYEAEKLFIKNFIENKALIGGLPQYQLIDNISKPIEKLGLLNKLGKNDRLKKLKSFYDSCVDNMA